MMLLILLRYPATWRQMLLMRDVLWPDYPLQHFTLQKSSEASKSFKILEKCQDFLEWGWKMMDALEKGPDGSCP